jgi:hypothetical protein
MQILKPLAWWKEKGYCTKLLSVGVQEVCRGFGTSRSGCRGTGYAQVSFAVMEHSLAKLIIIPKYISLKLLAPSRPWACIVRVKR